MFVTDRPFQPSLKFVSKANSLTYRVEQLKGASIRLAQVLPTNIREGLKYLSGTNTQAYYKNSQIMDVIFFIILGPGLKFVLWKQPGPQSWLF